MKTNDILLACNVFSDMYHFLQVVKATDKTVTVRRIYANKREGTPMVDMFVDDVEPMTKRVKDGRIRLSDWTSAEVWDGQPLCNEHPVWGLNYNLY